MSLRSPAPSPNRPLTVTIGGVISLLIGGLAVLLAVMGFLGKGGKADISTALPNLITGAASIIGAIGYLGMKKWAIRVYVIAVVGHFVSHGLLFASHSASGRITAPGIVSLLLIPVVALLVLIDMIRKQRRGLLS